ncbi:unnamed protein product [Lactuca virosa]|uniref:ABC1 atypical kinase-like domain-containing protein n=1 Tax=Lactuca virosa TaxID=75947 RepID=A0AAU9M790_9ASTR|nr:unnamed protein product [Lactuca virosa]
MGDLVAVKVQRPYVLETVTVELFIIRNLGLALRRFPQISLDVVGLVDEWAARFFEELDYINEGENETYFAEMMKKDLPHFSSSIFLSNLSSDSADLAREKRRIQMCTDLQRGFNCGEAGNFGTPKWLSMAKEAAVRRATMNFLPMLSHQQLLYLLTMSFIPRKGKLVIFFKCISMAETLPCVACGVLGYPFMSVIQPSPEVLFDNMPMKDDAKDESLEASTCSSKVNVDNGWNMSNGYLRPRIFCLEHASKVKELLDSIGGFYKRSFLKRLSGEGNNMFVSLMNNESTISLQPFPLQTNSLFDSHANAHLGASSPIRIGSIPRHINIHIHDGIGPRATNVESSNQANVDLLMLFFYNVVLLPMVGIGPKVGC